MIVSSIMHYVVYLGALTLFNFATAPGNDAQLQKPHNYVDVEKLENEFVLTEAEYLLSLANVKWTFTGNPFLGYFVYLVSWEHRPCKLQKMVPISKALIFGSN